MRKKILIIGSPGSGKTTLAKKLAQCLSINQISLDDIYWKPNWQRPTEFEFLKDLKEVLNEDEWIIDGNYLDWLDLRMEKANVIILLNAPTIRCIFRVTLRGVKRLLGERESLPARIKCSEDYRPSVKLSFKFIKLVLFYNLYTKPLIMQKLSNLGSSKYFFASKQKHHFEVLNFISTIK